MDPSPVPREGPLEWWHAQGGDRISTIANLLRHACTTDLPRSRNICAVKAKLGLSPNSALNICFDLTKGGVMKKVLVTVLEPVRATLLIAFAIGLGIAVHPMFFLAALLIAVVALVEAIINAAGQLTHRHP